MEHIELRGREPVGPEYALRLLLQGLCGRENLEDEVHGGERGRFTLYVN